MRVYERCSDFYIGHDGFFQKVLKLVYAQFGSNFDFFEKYFFSFVEKRANFTIEQQKC